MKKRALLGVAVVTLGLIGCSSDKSTDTSTDTSTADATAAPATEAATDAGTEAAATDAATTDAMTTDAAAPAAAPASGELEIFSWWTSGSEHAALEKLFNTTTKANPDVKIVDAAVAGGAGTNAKQVLATRISSGDIPATWQTHAGGALVDFVSQGVTVDLTDLYKEQNWASVLPKPLLDSMMVDGKITAVATGVHRGNVLFYNKAVLDKAGVTLGDSTSWADFEAAATKVKASGVTPLCLGDKDVWTDVTFLENILIGELGATGWNGLLDGSVKWSDPKVATAVEHFKTALSWAQEDHQSQDWTGAVASLAAGKCAFNSMGDWEYGELLVKQAKVDGTDFSATILGDANTFATVTDVFVVGKGSKNEAAAVAWMKALMDPVAQVEFAKLKGASPARTDVDLSSIGPVGQKNAKALASGTLVPSLVQDSALTTKGASQAFSDAVTLLVASGDGAKFAAAMDAAIGAK
jgi:glucose/mannose transport system substrate-binding protein